MKKLTVSAIVPAYNEEKYITGVLRVLVSSPLIDEIIVINDGSTDHTDEQMRSVPGLKHVTFRKNHGKGYAIAKGIEEAHSDIVLLVDADLVNFGETHIQQLTNPLIDKKADCVIGYRSAFVDKFFIPLSGERCYYRRDLLPYIETIRNKGYGVEMFLNKEFKDKRMRVVMLKGLRHVLKHKKQQYDDVVCTTLLETKEIIDECMRDTNPPRYFIETYLYLFYLKQLHGTVVKRTHTIQRAIDRYREELEQFVSQSGR